jgi:hypothetical protein
MYCKTNKNYVHHSIERRHIYSPLVFPLRHPLDYTNRNVFFDSSYMAEYLTTHRDFFFICTWNRLFLFFVFFFFLFACKQWGPSSPEGAQLTVRGAGFLLSRVLLLVILCWLFMFLLSTYLFRMTDVKLE